jgi:branched-chain amino acid aminotransferase
MTTQLFAVGEDGPRELRVASPGADVHEVLETLRGGVYSALRTFDHVRFLWLDAHFDRTERSMQGLGWSKTLDRPALRRALHATVSAYPHEDARVRFDVLQEPVEVQGTRADTFVALSQFVPVPEEFLRDGVKVDFAPYLHRREPKIKTTEFVRIRKPLPLGTRERYEHILIDGKQRILECSSSNISFVRGTELITAGDGVLEGITLSVLIEIAPTLGLRVRRERLPVDDLGQVRECFLTSSTRGVVPVVGISEPGPRDPLRELLHMEWRAQWIGNGSVGASTRALTESYYALAAQEAAPAA